MNPWALCIIQWGFCMDQRRSDAMKTNPETNLCLRYISSPCKSVRPFTARESVDILHRPMGLLHRRATL
eukprot:6208189-Pleurochrysis_carterae.AAC.1